MEKKSIQDKLEKAFQEKQWDVQWDHKSSVYKMNLAHQAQPLEISLPKLQQRINEHKLAEEEAILEVLDKVQTMMASVQAAQQTSLKGQERHIFPVIRSSSFPTESKQGKKLVFDEHTAESRIYYAVDLGKSYTIIDQALLDASGWSKQELKEKALFNLRGLENPTKLDVVADNYFYFISMTDGYAASRILNQNLLQEFAKKAEGDVYVAIPHQDVLVLADIRNSTGFDVLGQLTFQFYANGPMPITALPFKYENGKLEPVFILANRKPKQS